MQPPYDSVVDPVEERQLAMERLHILDAISTAIERRNDLLDLVDSSRSAEEALTRLQAEWGFTEFQAHAALDLQVRRFAGRERERIADERTELARRVAQLPG
jgi:DNA gyrase/topoisomerase IV subunit A